MSNRIKKDEIKNKLIKRNKTLLQMLDAKNVSNREVEKLRLAIDKDYVELFWIGHKIAYFGHFELFWIGPKIA